MKNSKNGKSKAKVDDSKSSEPFNVSESESNIRSKDASSEGGQVYYIVENTPFVIVRYKDAYRIAVGNQIVSDNEFKTIGEAEEYVKGKPWELIFALIMVIKNFKNNEK